MKITYMKLTTSKHFLLVFLFSISLTACDLLGGSNVNNLEGRKDVYTGVYTQAVEYGYFRPCAAENETWQFLPATEDEVSSFIRKTWESELNPVYVELRGTPGKKGEYSENLPENVCCSITYDRQFILEETIYVEKKQEKEC